MKKISLVLLSVFTLVFGSMLTACNFKDVKATFSQEEVVMSLNEQIDLKDFLTVDQLKTSEVDFKFSNPSLFEYENLKITAVASGISNVYATYKNNSLASMRIVVKKQFDAPKNFEVNDNVLQWNVPIGFIENDLTPTKPTSYLVEGECKIFSPTDPEEIVKVVQINQTLNTNSFELTDGGQYTLQITANANGYFDASEKSAEFVYYHDYMPKLTVEDLTWSNTGLLSWNYSEVNEAKFKVKMDGVILGDFTSETSKNLKTYFDNAESGEHSLSVLVYDINEKKLVQESEIIKVVKLSEPVVKQVDGQLEISTDSKATKYNVILNNGQQNMLLENSQNKIVTSLEGLASGIYTAQIYAMSENGNFYQSDIVDIGKIYKLPKVTISGVGNNLENGNILNVQAEVTESLIDTSFKLYGLGETLIVDGMTTGETVCNFEVSLTDPLSTLKLIATAKQSQNQIDGENTWVLNSDFSNSLSLTKVDAFTQEIVHNYEEEVSVLSFQKVENATNYLLFVNEASGYQPFTQASLDLDQAKFIFEDKIENLVEPVILDGRKIFDFKIVATIEDDKLAINSSITKQINLLEAPISAGSGNSTDLSYTWGAVENADGYNIEIYQISKQEYEDNKSTINLNKTGAEPEFVDTNHYNFESEGYYYVKIFAVSKDENMAISSQDCLKEVFYISKQLVIGNINFGYNNSYTTYPEFSDAKGYFIRMDKVDNVDGFEVVLTGGNATIFTVDNGDYCDILLAEDFSGTQEIEITVKGKSNDDTIYLDSNLQTLTIKKLTKVTFADLQFDDQMQNVSLNPAQFEGVSRIVMRDELNDDSVDVEGAIAVMPITNKTNFSLTIKLYGTKKTGDLYNQGNIIYLDGADSVLKIDRIDTPEQMIYQNSDLVITHNQNAISNTEYYLLNVICTTVSGEEKFVIQLGKTSTTAKIIYQSQTVEIGNSQDYISFVDNNVTIKLADLIEILTKSFVIWLLCTKY